jgi:hypothetical protein
MKTVINDHQNDTPVVPPQITPTKSITFNNRGVTKIVDLSELTDEECDQYIKRALEMYAESKQIDYNFERDRDNQSIKLGTIVWSDIVKFIEKTVEAKLQSNIKLWQGRMKKVNDECKNIDKIRYRVQK